MAETGLLSQAMNPAARILRFYYLAQVASTQHKAAQKCRKATKLRLDFLLKLLAVSCPTVTTEGRSKPRRDKNNSEEEARPGQARPGQARPGQARTGRDGTGRDGTGRDGTGRDRTGQDRTGQDRTKNRTGQDRTKNRTRAVRGSSTCANRRALQRNHSNCHNAPNASVFALCEHVWGAIADTS